MVFLVCEQGIFSRRRSSVGAEGGGSGAGALLGRWSESCDQGRGETQKVMTELSAARTDVANPRGAKAQDAQRHLVMRV